MYTLMMFKRGADDVLSSDVIQITSDQLGKLRDLAATAYSLGFTGTLMMGETLLAYY